MREATAHAAGRVTAADRPEPADAGAEPHVRDRLDFTLKQPVVGVSVTEARAAADPGGADETDTRLGPVWAAGFLQVGASAVVGPWWPVPAGADAVFVRAFYAAVRDGVPLGPAAGRARDAVRLAYPNQPHWLASALFGHPAARPYPVEAVDGFTFFEALNPPADGKFVPGAPYQFRASYRAERPVWYEGRLRLAGPDLDGDGVAVLVVPLSGGAPVQAELRPSGRVWFADVELPAPSKAEWRLVAKFHRDEEEIQTVFLTLPVAGAVGDA